MNTSKLYTQLKKIESTYHTPDGYETLMNLIRDTEEEIRKEANKQSGSASVYKSACSILKEAQKTRHADMLCKAHRSKETLDIYDFYRLVRFNLDTAPALPEHPKRYRISGVYFEASNGCGLMLPLNQKEVQK